MTEIIVPDPNLDPRPGEINVLRRQTTQYIKQNQADVVLNRKSVTDDGAGGVIHGADHFLDAQHARIIQTSESESVERRTVDGENVVPILNMLMEWDADVQEGDQFTWNGHTCEVVYIMTMQYEKTCEVAFRSKAS